MFNSRLDLKTLLPPDGDKMLGIYNSGDLKKEIQQSCLINT